MPLILKLYDHSVLLIETSSCKAPLEIQDMSNTLHLLPLSVILDRHNFIPVFLSSAFCFYSIDFES
jgi:hypothetical protein